MPIGSRDHGLARSETICQRTGCDLGLVEIGSEIDIRRTNKLAEFGIFDVAVYEHHIPLHPQVACKLLERFSVTFSILAHKVGMRRAEDNVNNVGMLLNDLGQGSDGVLDAFSRREETEGEKDRTPCHAKVIFIKIRICKRNVRNSVRDNRDFFFRDSMNIAQHFRTVIRHHNKFTGAFNEIGKRPALFASGMGKHRVERCHNRHSCAVQEICNVAACWPAEDAKFVLQTENVGMRKVQKICSTLVTRGFRFGDLKPHFRRIMIRAARLRNGDHRALPTGVVAIEGTSKIPSKCCNTAFPRRIVAKNCCSGWRLR